MRCVVVLLCAVSLVGCSRLPSLPTFGFARGAVPEAPLPFDARIQTTRTSRDFAITVDQGGADIEAVRESVRFPATRHCILRFGSSQVDWDLDAAGQDWEATRDESGRALYRGRCSGR